MNTDGLTFQEQEFKRTTSSLEDLFGVIDRFSSTHGITEEHAGRLRFVAEELFTNLVKYNKREAPIMVGLSTSQQSVFLKFVDRQEAPFDPAHAVPPDLTVPLQDRKPGGLGVHLVKKMSARLDYEWKEGVSVITVRVDPGSHDADD